MSQKHPTLQKQRVWEIDAFRGFLILNVLVVHLYSTVDSFCINGYYNIDSYAWVNRFDPLHFWYDWGSDGEIYKPFLTEEFLQIWVHLGMTSFFIVSGISSSFTHNNLKRVLRLLVAAYFIAAFTYGLYLWSGEHSRFTRFGVLHCYAYCQLIYTLLLEKRTNKFLIILAVPILIVGYYLYFHPVFSTNGLLYPFGIYEKGVIAVEYFPIFPFLGWILLGVVWGRKYYSARKSILPYPLAEKLTGPLQWLGRNSGAIYIAHIIAYPVIFGAIGYIFHLLD